MGLKIDGKFIDDACEFDKRLDEAQAFFGTGKEKVGGRVCANEKSS